MLLELVTENRVVGQLGNKPLLVVFITHRELQETPKDIMLDPDIPVWDFRKGEWMSILEIRLLPWLKVTVSLTRKRKRR